MRRTVQGIVLREINYKEADKILTVLTREEGKLTLKARGCRRKNCYYHYYVHCPYPFLRPDLPRSPDHQPRTHHPQHLYRMSVSHRPLLEPPDTC